MYSEISSIFLNNLRALRYYVSSVDPTMDIVLDAKLISSQDAIFAGIIYMLTKAQEEGYQLSDESRRFEDVPEEAVNFIKSLENLFQEMGSDGSKVSSYLPRNIRVEYQKFEAREKQKEILYRGSLLLLVTYFENLIAGVLRESFVKYPQRISLDEKSVSYKMLTEMENIEEIKNALIDQEVTNKMYDSMLEWKKYFQKNLKLELKAWDDEFEFIQEIMARRNLYVHNNGIINSIYINLVKEANKDSIGNILSIDREYIDNAIDIIEYIGMSLIIEVWIKECADNQEEVNVITDMIYEEYLEPFRWKMARHFYELCLKSSKILNADRILCKINIWQCYKWLGEYDKVRDEVKKVDVSAFKPMYTLGILALNEDYERFFEFYDHQTDIREEQLKEWPLFMELRKSKEYLERYPEEKIKEQQQIECKVAEDVTDI